MTDIIIPPRYLEQISPIEQVANNFLDRVNSTVITDDQTFGIAIKLKKQVTTFINTADKQRLAITQPARDLVSAINAKAESAVKPATKAKEVITSRILQYEAELEAKRVAEQKRIAEINKVFLLADTKATIEENREMVTKVESHYKSLPHADREIPEIKQACFALVERINQKILYLQEQEALKAESERLAKIKAEQDGVALQQEQERQRQAQVERGQQAEQRRLKDEEIKVKLEKERIEKEKASTHKISTGIRTYTKFRIIDAGIIPREYCEPSDKLINQAIKDGKQDIPGIEIYQDKK